MACITGPHGVVTAEERLEGYRNALAEAKLRLDRKMIVHGDGKPEGASAAIAKLLALPRRPTAILCYNDMSALGAMHELRSAGVRIPEDISVVGFDDIALAAYSSPALTTVKQDWAKIGNELVRIVLGLLDGTVDQASSRIALPTELIVRASTAPPRL